MAGMLVITQRPPRSNPICAPVRLPDVFGLIDAASKVIATCPLRVGTSRAARASDRSIGFMPLKTPAEPEPLRERVSCVLRADMSRRVSALAKFVPFRGIPEPQPRA